MRLFVALLLDDGVKTALRDAQDALRRQGWGHFVKPENLHLTLAFLGEVSSPENAMKALAEIDCEGFSLSVKRVGHFGRLYWAGAVLSPQLDSLQRQTTQALTRAGFVLENRAFHPHLTLCREFCTQSGTAPNLRLVEQALGAPTCAIERVSLMCSARSGGRLVYTEIGSKKLKRTGL